MAGRAVFFAALPLAAASFASGVRGRNGWVPQADQDDALLARPMFMLRHAPGVVAKLEELVADVSTPGHPDYGAYLDMAGLRDRLQVTEGALEAVLALLEEHGIEKSKISVSASGDMVYAEMPTAVANKMFTANFVQFGNPRTLRSIVRAADDFTVPGHIAGYVYLVGNLNEFPDVRRPIHVQEMPEVSSSSTGFGGDCSGCGGRVTPGVLAARYGLNASEDRGISNSNDTGMATAEFQGVYYDNASLDYFKSTCSLKQEVRVDNQIGSNLEWHCLTGDACVEALLDIEYAKAASGGNRLTNVFSEEYSLLNWAKAVDDLGDTGPSVHSISYGDDEVQQGDDAPSGTTGKAYMEATNVQFAKLAARGISVMVASGDQGVCGRTGCQSKRFHPDFPASSPYITAVGATDFVARGVVGEEQVWSSGGGGFSDEFQRPAWQRQAVEGYLAAAAKAGKLPEASAFNNTGRAYPDVAALGGQQNPYCIAAKILPFIEKMQGVAGTSASCPVFAGVVSRLNAVRLAKGLPRMGFMNPWIYQHPEVFHDVTKGLNDDGHGQGFAAMAGWDPATGMGTPDFGKMLHAALATVEGNVLVV